MTNSIVDVTVTLADGSRPVIYLRQKVSYQGNFIILERVSDKYQSIFSAQNIRDIEVRPSYKDMPMNELKKLVKE